MKGRDGTSGPARDAVLVLCPLPREAAPLVRRLAERRRFRLKPSEQDEAIGGRSRELAGWRGRLAGRTVAVVVTGDGEAAARRGAETALARLPGARLLVLGVAGALSPELGIGDRVVAQRVIGPDDEVASASGNAVALAAERTGAVAGAVLTRRRLALDGRSKARLLAHLEALPGGRGAGPAVVDLETSFYIAAAEARGLPWLVVRAVSDAAGDALPAYLESSRDSGGSISVPRVVGYALARPWTVPSLLRLGRRTDRAARDLAAAAEALLAAGW